jgi:hypothetical protein
LSLSDRDGGIPPAIAGNAAQRAAKSCVLPVEGREFLLRDEMRGVRFALEYSKAELLLREWRRW